MKGHVLRSVRVVDSIPMEGSDASLLLARASFAGGTRHTYALPIVGGADGTGDPSFWSALLQAIGRRRTFRGLKGRMAAIPVSVRPARLPVSLQAGEQSNTTAVFGKRLVLKLLRRVEPGVHPDLEMVRLLAERASFRHVPPVAGYVEYRPRKGKPCTLAILGKYVKSRGDAWTHALREASRGSITSYRKTARLLGVRVAQMHAALASAPRHPDFRPEPFTPRHRRELRDSLKRRARKSLALLRRKIERLPGPLVRKGVEVLRRTREIRDILGAVGRTPLRSMRIRCHGDLHLGQVLRTERDFVFVDFEGEPGRPLAERRRKDSPLKDVAGMLRSFHYAACTARAPRAWHEEVTSTFRSAYLDAAASAGFLRGDDAEIRTLLEAFLMDKAVYELGYELNNRPDWVRIPLRGILDLLDGVNR